MGTNRAGGVRIWIAVMVLLVTVPGFTDSFAQISPDAVRSYGDTGRKQPPDDPGPKGPKKFVLPGARFDA